MKHTTEEEVSDQAHAEHKFVHVVTQYQVDDTLSLVVRVQDPDRNSNYNGSCGHKWNVIKDPEHPSEHHVGNTAKHNDELEAI